MASLGVLASGTATCADLLQCVLDLNELERDAYFCLVAAPERTLDDLADRLRRERSTVHRAVAKLVSLGLATKENRGTAGGGYRHVYRAVEPERVASLLDARFAEARARAESLLATFPRDARRAARGMGGAPSRKRSAPLARSTTRARAG